MLLHGFYGDRTTWRSAGYVDALAGRYRLICVDARGHGESYAPHGAESYRIDRQVDDVVAVLDSLGVHRAAVWGASMGGTIGFRLLARHPERLTCLIAGAAHAEPVTADPAGVEREAAILRAQGTAPFLAWLERAGRLPPWLRATVEDADPYALAALTTAMAGLNGVEDDLARTPVPVLMLAGDGDRRLPEIRRTAARIPGARFVELPGCGHLDAFLRTDLTLPAVRPFLARCAAQR